MSPRRKSGHPTRSKRIAISLYPSEMLIHESAARAYGFRDVRAYARSVLYHASRFASDGEGSAQQKVAHMMAMALTGSPPPSLPSADKSALTDRGKEMLGLDNSRVVDCEYEVRTGNIGKLPVGNRRLKK